MRAAILAFVLDPKVFNYTIMVLYGLNVIRWGIERKPADCFYWGGALWITCAVTFGYRH